MSPHHRTTEIAADVVIIGGGTGACAAALAATRLGARVVMTEETDWIGGQITSQMVPPDEHRWIESSGCTQTYRQFRNLVRDYYWRFYPMARHLRGMENLNPGGGDVSRICFEPRVGLAVLESMLAPARSGGRLNVLLNTRAVSAVMNGDRVEAVTVERTEDGERTVLRAPYFIDATEQGDLLPLTKTEYITGAESKEQTSEPHAKDKHEPNNVQPITWVFACDHLEGENHVIDKPEQYDDWKSYVPALTPPWPGRLLALPMSHPHDHSIRPMGFSPIGATEHYNLWVYRRIAAKEHFEPGAYAGDISLINIPQNDYLNGRIYDVSEEEKRIHLFAAKQLSLSLFYWLQTEAPRPDGGIGWPGLRLKPDIAGTNDGLAKYPYIREGRRIRAEFTVTENHIGADARRATGPKNEAELWAEQFDDSVGVGCYRIDLHPTVSGDNYVDIASLPFQIPLGALIPQRVENLIAGCKNIGTTHITNGCYRVHPCEWNIGESAGALAAHCVRNNVAPKQVRHDKRLLAEFQHILGKLGVQLKWNESAVV